ncbi:hypothetical protein OIU34_18630 [Pararhizobium sp. BT-229]|uniref:hypothetical protein n=1 Tax=Pararhizobium sp. BT-229 TaxID=2986923 RepID=UPI0021F7F07F|nr:hypothetical protein [Pararhizobium sp. BT-229]MCV9963896.1 hypothetical protein [Pararhizobium sp. BT-229]
MSSGKECMIFENQPAEWYYALESDFSDGDEWDWREDASAYGPFPSYEAACDHLSAHHSNPGGHTMVDFADLERERDKVIDQLVAGAADNMKPFRRPTSSYRMW